MSILETKNVSKQYPGTLALDNVTVSFESGKVHAFIGKNGSGKSTLVNVFSGSTAATSGKVFLDGKRTSVSQSIRGTGMRTGDGIPGTEPCTEYFSG